MKELSMLKRELKCWESMFERTHGRKPTKVRPKSIESLVLTGKHEVKHNIIFVWVLRAAVNYAQNIKTLRSYCADVIHNYVNVFPSETCLLLCLCLCLCLFHLLEMGLACNKDEYNHSGHLRGWGQKHGPGVHGPFIRTQSKRRVLVLSLPHLRYIMVNMTINSRTSSAHNVHLIFLSLLDCKLLCGLSCAFSDICVFW